MDITGANDVGMMPGANKAITAALAYGDRVDPARIAGLKAELTPLLDRFMPDHYAAYTPQERARLRTALDSLHRTLQQDSTRGIHATSHREYARGVRNAWEAIHLNDLMARGVGKPDGMIRAGVTLRDSLMAENAAWALGQEGNTGRLFVFAHDGHVLNTQAVLDSARATLLGFRLRARFHSSLVIIASMAGTLVGGKGDVGGWLRGSEVVVSDSTTFAAALAKVGPPLFIVDVRTADRSPNVSAALSRPWGLPMAGFTLPIIPRQAFDAVVYFDRITPTELLH
jgi:erythromycin esterase-like protein